MEPASCSLEGRGWTGNRRKASAHAIFGEQFLLNRGVVAYDELSSVRPRASPLHTRCLLTFVYGICLSAPLLLLLLCVLRLNSSREYLMVLPSNIRQGTQGSL